MTNNAYVNPRLEGNLLSVTPIVTKFGAIILDKNRLPYFPNAHTTASRITLTTS